MESLPVESDGLRIVGGGTGACELNSCKAWIERDGVGWAPLDCYVPAWNFEESKNSKVEVWRLGFYEVRFVKSGG